MRCVDCDSIDYFNVADSWALGGSKCNRKIGEAQMTIDLIAALWTGSTLMIVMVCVVICILMDDRNNKLKGG